MRRTEFWWGTVIVLFYLTMLGHAHGQAVPAPALNSQLLARTGTVVLKVADYDSARRQVLETALTQGAELMDAKTTVDPKGRKYGWMQLRVSSERLPALLPAVQEFGRLYTDHVMTTDNISEYEELARRVTRLHQHEGRLSGVLQSPRRMRGSDILYLQERLFRASVDESLLSQQRLDLERSAVTSTVTVELFEPGTQPAVETARRIDLTQRFAGAAGLARNGLNHQMARVATAGAYVLVYAPIWVPALIIALLLLRWAWMRRREIIDGATSLLARAVIVLTPLLRWVRTTWEARHQPLGFSPMSEEERRMRAEAHRT